MSVTHRILYVGIGGTGVHVGKEFELALRRDLCGPDGRSLIRKGGPCLLYTSPSPRDDR